MPSSEAGGDAAHGRRMGYTRRRRLLATAWFWHERLGAGACTTTRRGARDRLRRENAHAVADSNARQLEGSSDGRVELRRSARRDAPRTPRAGSSSAHCAPLHELTRGADPDAPPRPRCVRELGVRPLERSVAPTSRARRSRFLAGAATRDDARDGSLAVNLLGSEPVVRAAPDSQVGGMVVAAEASRHDVVVLEPGTALAAGTVGANPGTAKAIALEHRTTSGTRQMPGLMVSQRGCRGCRRGGRRRDHGRRPQWDVGFMGGCRASPLDTCVVHKGTREAVTGALCASTRVGAPLRAARDRMDGTAGAAPGRDGLRGGWRCGGCWSRFRWRSQRFVGFVRGWASRRDTRVASHGV